MANDIATELWELLVLKPCKQVFERFLAHTNHNNSWQGCWSWKKSLDKDGYPRITIAGRTSRAHREISAWLHGGIDGLVVDHVCNTPNCVNPVHLRPCTGKENTLRKGSKAEAWINKQKKTCKKGHALTLDNLVKYQWKKNGKRNCLICQRELQKAYKTRKYASTKRSLANV